MSDLMSRRRALMGAQNGGSTPILPAEYQQVEWVGVRNTTTTPTAYISVGQVINSGDTLNVELKPFNIIGQYDSPIGYYTYDSGIHSWELYYTNNGNKFELYHSNPGSTLVSYSISDWDSAIISFAANSGLTLLTYRTNSYAFSGKIKSVVVTNSSNNVTHNYIPCYRKADTAIGFYDLITDTFLTKSGTGTLLKGADV